MEQEAWLSGAIEDVSPLLMPAAHALVQAARDIERATTNLSDAELWATLNGAPSVGFHLLHIAGSCDRLSTYARGDALSDEQFAALDAENKADNSRNVVELAANAIGEIEKILTQIGSIPVETLFERREVGRRRLSTNVFGLLFHIAEHTQRHVGQIVATAKIVGAAKNEFLDCKNKKLAF